MAAFALGSLLSFLIQPMTGQWLTPAWGGTPAVWLTCMVFFQGALLVGYGWAWWVSRSRRSTALIWQALLLTLAAAIVWRLEMPAVTTTTVGSPTLALLVKLLTTLGIPVIALTTTSPLLQHWLSNRSSNNSSVYRWFALSNFSSLCALLTYPFWIQPYLSLSSQLVLWRWAYACFLLSFFVVIIRFHEWNEVGGTSQTDTAPAPSGSLEPAIPTGYEARQAVTERLEPRSSRLAMLSWWLLSFGPAVLLMAVTNQLNADLSAGPLLWVLPLGLYLLTFTLAFNWPSRRSGVTMLCLAGASAIAMMVVVWLSNRLPATVIAAGLLSGLFGLSLWTHLRLVNLQPRTGALTAYYGWIAIGGWCGGLFVGFLAPMIFSHYFELELAVLACWWSSLWIHHRQSGIARATPGSVLKGTTAHTGHSPGLSHRFLMILVTLGVSAVCLLSGLAKLPMNQATSKQERVLHQIRTFYGLHRITERNTPAGTLRTIGHGSTDHGRQYIDGPFARQPSGYYSVGSGVDVALHWLRDRSSKKLQVAVMGLGAGNLVHWGQPEDRWTFFELDPEVPELAKQYFTNLKTARCEWEIRLGDARQGLQAAIDNGQRFDLIIMDAFSGDSVPAHLLTSEAWQIYLGGLEPGGIAAVHISNRYVNLQPVLAATADRYDLHGWLVTKRPLLPPDGRLSPGTQWRELTAFLENRSTLLTLGTVRRLTDIDIDPRRSEWVLLSPTWVDPGHTAGESSPRFEIEPLPNDHRVQWTDDFAPLLPVLK